MSHHKSLNKEETQPLIGTKTTSSQKVLPQQNPNTFSNEIFEMQQNAFDASSNVFNTSSIPTTNYARLLCIVVERGTERMQNFVMKNLPKGCDSLEEALALKQNHFKSLQKKYKIISNKQLNELYPPAGTPINVSSIDMSLWYVLVRNLAVVGRRVNFQKFENPPGPGLNNQLNIHDIIRIRNMRNTLFHVGTSPQIDNYTFKIMWQEITDALTRLGVMGNVIQQYHQKDLDPMKSLILYMNVREQMNNELQMMHQSELERRKHIFMGFMIVALFLIIVSAVMCYVMYHFTGTWESCVQHIKNLYSTSNIGGAISFMPRTGWHAKPPKKSNPLLKHPLPYVIISHSAMSGACYTSDDCCNTAQLTQRVSFSKGDDDIAYSFLVGNDGVIFEGRGWNTTSAIAGRLWNNVSISIGFMGTFIMKTPSDEALYATLTFLQYMVDNNILTRNFTLYGLCEVRPFPYAPGPALYEVIQRWEGIGPTNPWSWRNRTGSFCRDDISS